MTLMSARPVIAVTIGDPAGIGPEIVVRAVALEAVRASAEIVVIGDRGRLQEAARATGIPPHFGETTSLIDLGNVPAGMDPRAVKCPPVNTNLAGSAMTRQQPVFNVIRSTVQALASLLGGVNGMEIKAYTEVMSSSTTAALVINRGIEAILAEETGVCQTVDPLAGSYYVEWLTGQVEDGARRLLDEILRRGGVRACIQSGWVQALVEEGARQRQRELEEGQRIQVGVNAYQTLVEPEISLPMLDALDRGTPARRYSDLQREILEEVSELRAWRDTGPLARALRDLFVVTREGQNVVRAMIDAWKADATLGEIAGTIRVGLGLAWDEWGLVTKPEWLDLG